jgi:hypothetical protein
MTFNFSLVAIDQIINAAAKLYSMSGGQYNVPIVFRGPTGNAGQLGAQHSQNFENWFANTPGLKVVVPSNPYDAKGLLKTAIRDDDLVVVFENKMLYGLSGEVPEGEYIIPLGVADIKREGTDVTIVAISRMVHQAQIIRRDVWNENHRESRNDRLVITRGRRRHEQIPADELVLVAVVGQPVQLSQRPSLGSRGHVHSGPLLAAVSDRTRGGYACAAQTPHRFHAGAPNRLQPQPCTAYARQRGRVNLEAGPERQATLLRLQNLKASAPLRSPSGLGPPSQITPAS